MNIAVKKLDFYNQICINSSVVVFCKTKDVKSCIIKDIINRLQTRRKFNTSLCFSSSKDQYKDVQPKFVVFERYDEKLVETFRLNHQVSIRNNGKWHPNNNALFLVDECLDGEKIVKCKANLQIVKCASHHYEIFVLLAADCMTKIGPELRTSIDYVFVTKQIDFEEKKMIYIHYASFVPSFDIFCSILDSICQSDDMVMVIDNSASSDNIQNRIFWFKIQI